MSFRPGRVVSRETRGGPADEDCGERLPDPGWRHAGPRGKDTVEAVRELRGQPGKDLLVIGSGDFAQTLIESDLVDEYRLMIHPIVVGGGKRLFRNGNPLAKLMLTDSKTSTRGVVILTYRPE
jgi:riboflavin biosynthesis pyrimidine reductase